MAKMPFRENARIDSSKFTYLFEGKHKDEFARFGITAQDVEWLESALLDIARQCEYVGEAVEKDFGWSYSFYEMVRTPQGNTCPLLSAWLLPYTSDIPHFVTAYPRMRRYKGKVL